VKKLACKEKVYTD